MQVKQLSALKFINSPTPSVHIGEPHLIDEPKIKEIAKAHKKEAAQVLIRYQIQRGNIVIPKSVTKSRIISNINVFDFDLTDDEVKAIDAFERNGRLCPESG